eukprot:5649991-Alexandrium_andersonii.AAC.1
MSTPPCGWTSASVSASFTRLAPALPPSHGHRTSRWLNGEARSARRSKFISRVRRRGSASASPAGRHAFLGHL